MRTTTPRHVMLALEPVAFGDVPLVPPRAADRSEPQTSRSMAGHLLASRPETAGDALKLLRNAFPHAPLAARVAALNKLMGR